MWTGFLIAGLAVVPAVADAKPVVKQEIVRKTVAFDPGEPKLFAIDCKNAKDEDIRSSGRVVVAYVISQGPLIDVFSSKNYGDQWIARGINRGSERDKVTIEARCMVVVHEEDPELVDYANRTGFFENLATSAKARIQCPPGSEPVGWGSSESAPGNPANDPPDATADNRIYKAMTVGDEIRFGVQHVAGPPVDLTLQAVCAKEKVTRKVDLVHRLEPFGEISFPPFEVEQVDVRCPRGSVAAGFGWNLPAEEQVVPFVFPTPPDEHRLTHFGFFNATDQQQEGAASACCLSVRRD